MEGFSLDRFFFMSPNLMAVTDRDGFFIKVNASYQRELGYDQHDLYGRTIYEIVHEEDRELTKTEYANLSEKVPAVKFNNRLIAKDGGLRWMEWYTAVSKDEGMLYSFGTNITNQKETERKLLVQNRQVQEQEVKNKSMLESIGDGVIAINDGGEIVLMNNNAEAMLKINAKDVMGKMLLHSVKVVREKGEPVNQKERPMHMATFSGKSVINKQDLYFARADNTIFPASITATPVKLHDKLIGGVLVFRDITHEREVDRMKTEFISLASHQLRTPLSAMKWFSEMLLAGDTGQLTTEQTEFVTNIYQSNERMIELVNSLLNISRIESGRIIIDPVPTDLKMLVEEVLKELQPKITAKGHRLGVSVHGELPKVNIDPKLVRHVYMNLLTNAIKYTKNGGDITVIISKDNNNVISQISDNGFGIPQSQKEQVFQKFFRAENVVKVETDGTGLGLYLIKAIVDSSGGRIWFESQENVGTTFWFSLPLTGTPAKKGEVTIDS